MPNLKIWDDVAGVWKYVGADNAAPIFTAMREPTGFPNRTDSTWAFVDDTLTIIPAVTSYDIWFDGVKHTIAVSKDIAVADTEGIHLIYFDTDDILKEYVNPTIAQVLTFIRDKVAVALIYWDATNNAAVYVGEERHGTVMDGLTHYYLHYTRGLQWVSGLGLGDFVIGNGSLDTHAQFSVAEGSVSDEDLGLSISEVGSTDGIPILYRLGADGYWRGLTQANFACYQNPDGATHRLMYNQLTGGAWQLTEIGEGNYVLYHIFATTGKDTQMYSIMGQAEYATQPAARAGAQVEISSLLLGNLPSVEMRPIATVLFQTDKDYGNSINGRVIEAVSGGDDYVDWRTNDLPRGVAPSSHSSLTALQLAQSGVTYGHIDDQTQTIAGVKTFSSFPVTPSSAPTTDYQTANKKYVDDSGGGWDGDIADINLDGGTDIGAALADADLILVDDGAGGTNRKAAMSRVKTYIEATAAMVMIADSGILGADAANIDFSSIPATYKHLILKCSCRSDAAATYDIVRLRFNNDSGNNYDTILPVLYTSYTFAEELAAASIWATTTTAANSVAGDFGKSTIEIIDYANANINKDSLGMGGWRGAATTGLIRLYNSYGHWRSTSAINRITIFPGAGTKWKQYSRITLYGLN